MQTLAEAEAGISAVQFSPKGDRIAAGSWDSRLYVWQLRGQSAQLRAALGGHEGGVSDVIFAEGGRALLASSASGKITVWDTEQQRPIKRVLGYQNGISSLGLSADDALLIGGSVQGGLTVWDWRLAGLLGESCDRLGSYLLTNPNVSNEARERCR